MRGVILAIAPDGTYGQLSAEDGQRYSYWTSEIRNGPAQIGQGVDFQLWEGQPVDIFLLTRSVPVPPPGAPAPQPVANGGASAVQAAYAAMPTSFANAFSSLPALPYWITLFSSTAGRISRLQFWLHGVLPIFVVSLVFGWIPFIGILVSLALFWASVCICFKRFHDLGLPGWWSLVNLVPMAIAAAFTAGSFFGSGFAWLLAEVFWGLGLLVIVAQLVFVYLRVGERGPNDYGPDPLAGASRARP
jgi:uncharacterized membrane protein YhaH (DUF805 family)